MTDLEKKAAQKAYNAAYYANNRAKLLVKFREWKAANRELHRATSAEWQKNNPERSNASKSAYKKRNPEKTKEYQKRETDQARGSHAARQSVRNRLFQSSTTPEVKALYTLSASDALLTCAWCKTETKKGNRHVDHVQPIALGGTHAIENLCIACKSCNLSKGALDPEIFRARRTS